MYDGYCNDCGKDCPPEDLTPALGKSFCRDCIFLMQLSQRCMDECFSLTIPQFRDKTRIAGLVL